MFTGDLPRRRAGEAVFVWRRAPAVYGARRENCHHESRPCWLTRLWDLRQGRQGSRYVEFNMFCYNGLNLLRQCQVTYRGSTTQIEQSTFRLWWDNWKYFKTTTNMILLLWTYSFHQSNIFTPSLLCTNNRDNALQNQSLFLKTDEYYFLSDTVTKLHKWCRFCKLTLILWFYTFHQWFSAYEFDTHIGHV